jgi:Tol biopolymer transport system component
VTAFPGLETSPSISPDGKFVVFSWTGPDPAGVPDLWIKAVDNDARTRLTETTSAESWPAWSPDGSEIAFVRTGQGIFITSRLGGQEQTVSESGSMVGWTPDGRSLLIRDRTGDGAHAIFRVDLGTGMRDQLTRPATGIGDWAFDVSPDGRRLVFVRAERPGISDVYVVPLTGGEPRRVTNWNASIGRVSWMPDNRHILYSVNEPGGIDESLFSIPADRKQPDRGRRVIQGSGTNPSASRSARDKVTRVAFTARRIDVGLRLVDLAGSRSGEAFESVSRFADSTRVDVSGHFSRDGERVAFVSDRAGSGDVWIARRDGSDVNRATTLQAPELMIGGWSPDDRHLVIDTALGGNSDLYVISLDGRPRAPDNGPRVRRFERMVGRWPVDLLHVDPIGQSGDLENSSGGRRGKSPDPTGWSPAERIAGRPGDLLPGSCSSRDRGSQRRRAHQAGPGRRR